MSDMSAGSVSGWIAGLKQGDPGAPERLWDRYCDRLVVLARRRLGSSPRRVADEEDVALTVFHSLCRRAAQGRFAGLKNREDLWALLVGITRQKVIDQRRHELRQKRGGGQVREASAIRGNGDEEFALDQVVADDPTPVSLAIMVEEHQRLLNALPDAICRQIALGKLDGVLNAELAERLGISLRSVERKLEFIREIWSRSLRADEAS